MSLYLIANPHARNGLGRRRLQALCRELERRGARYELALCNGLEHATQLSQAANRAWRETVVAVGGDGTINRVLNGFFDSEGKRLSSARMGVVHIGTSPDFCRSYGVPTAIEPAVEALLGNVTRSVAVGQVTCAPEHRAVGQEPRTAFFGCCANLGLGAAVARGANGGIRRYAGDFLGTLFSLLWALSRFRPRQLVLTLDGERRTLDGVYNIAVGKTRYIASGLQVHHALLEQDRRFYVMCVRRLSWRTFGPALRAVYGGRPVGNGDCVSLTYANTVEVEPVAASVEVEYDGDPAGYCPCRIVTAPDPLELLVGGSA